jgi:hypothetical protein
MTLTEDVRLLLLRSHRLLLLLFSLKVLEHWLEIAFLQRLDLYAFFLIRQHCLRQMQFTYRWILFDHGREIPEKVLPKLRILSMIRFQHCCKESCHLL